MKKINIIFLTALFTLLSKCITFLREMIIANFYGVSSIIDCYLLASYMITIFFGWLTCTSTAIIPTYQDAWYENKDNAYNLVCRIISIVFVLAGLLICIGVLFTKPLVKISAIGFDSEQLYITNIFFRILLVNLFLIAPSQIFFSIMKCHEKIVAINMINLLSNIFQVFLYISFSELPYFFIPIIGICSNLLIFILSFWQIHKIGINFKFTISIDEHVKKVFRASIPIFLGSFLSEINMYVDKMIASTLAEGVIASLGYAINIEKLVREVISLGLFMFVFPEISLLVSKKEKDEVRSRLYNYILIVALLYIPIIFGGSFLAESIVSVIYERGAFDSYATIITAKAFKGYLVGGFFSVISSIFTFLLYAYTKSKVVIVSSCIGFVTNFILDLILGNMYEGFGLALASSISALFVCGFCYFYVSCKLKLKLSKDELRILFSSFFCSIVMLIFLHEFNAYILCKYNLSLIVSLCFNILSGMILYIVLLSITCFSRIIKIIKL